MGFTITKKLAQQGDNIVLIIPKDLKQFLKRGDLIEVKINKIADGERKWK